MLTWSLIYEGFYPEDFSWVSSQTLGLSRIARETIMGDTLAIFAIFLMVGTLPFISRVVHLS